MYLRYGKSKKKKVNDFLLSLASVVRLFFNKFFITGSLANAADYTALVAFLGSRVRIVSRKILFSLNYPPFFLLFEFERHFLSL